MRGFFAFLTMAASALALAGCGPSYPADKQNWTLVGTPFAPPDSTIDGRLDLLPPNDVSEGARLYDGFQNLQTSQKLNIFWEGSWTGDKEGIELDLSCTDAFAENVEPPDCATATLKLSCEVVGEKLDCGDYVFQ
jgi:hypothetical protein